MTTQELRTKLNKLTGSRDTIAYNLRQSKVAYTKASRDLAATEEAQALLQHVAEKTQSLVRYHITELGSTALEAVFGGDIKLGLEFRVDKGKTVADLFFLRGPEGKLVDPLSSDSGGAADIAAMALRCSLWSLQKPRTRPVMILDEPLKNINDDSRKMHHKAAEMIKLISKKLRMQFLIVTALPELEEVADKVYRF